jgi:hypothetical protein
MTHAYTPTLRSKDYTLSVTLGLPQYRFVWVYLSPSLHAPWPSFPSRYVVRLGVKDGREKS